MLDGNQVYLSRTGAADGLDCNYAGILEDDGRTIKGEVLCIAAAESADVSRRDKSRHFWAAIQCPRETAGLACADPQGIISTEAGKVSRWTRTDQTGKYTVHREPGAVGDPTLVQLKVNGAEVVVETLSSPDGKSCRFEGRIGAGGRSITGLMHCPGADAVGWTAEVRCRAFDPC